VSALTGEAIETNGRSEVEKFLTEERPPTRISLADDGYVVRR
jgi:hypothetical protein